MSQVPTAARRRIPLIIVILLSFAVAFGALTTGHDWGGDFASYIMQAESITRGDIATFTARNAFTIEQSNSALGPIAYPWGYPLLLAPVVQLFGPSMLSLKFVGVASLLVCLLASFILFEPRVGSWGATLIVATIGFAPAILTYADQVLSDLPFLALSTLALVLIDRSVMKPTQPDRRWGLPVLLGLVMFAAYFVRAAGILLLPTLLGTQIASHWLDSRGQRYRLQPPLQLAVPYVLFGILALAAAQLFPWGSGSYVELSGTLSPATVARNIFYYAKMPMELLPQIPARDEVYAVLFLFCGVGFAASLKDSFMFSAYAGLTIVMCILWPAQQGIRLLLPALPILVYLAFVGTKTSAFALANVNRKLGIALTYFFWFAISALLLLESASLARANLGRDRNRDGPFDKVSSEMFEYISTATAETATIGFFKPRVMRLITDRDAIQINRAEALCRADYYVRWSGSGLQLTPEDVAEQVKLKRLDRRWNNERFTVYATADCFMEQQ